MLDIHIDDFCKDSALSLKILYDAFPCNSDLLVDQIIGPDELDDFGLHSRRHQACLATMLWLADEGLIRYGGLIQQDGVDQAVLTNAAFSLLSSPSQVELIETDDASIQLPTAQEEGLHFASQITGLIPTQSSQKIRTLMLCFFAKHSESQTNHRIL
ncbi:MAG: hypothetical protein KUG83_07080 [Gammaproteobacteria bacterium]|nr:hypothetical protein [Gammaproteobacteria bacterium]